MALQRIVRLKDVIDATGMSRSAIYARIKSGLWPRPVPLGERMVGFPAVEVDAITSALIARTPPEQIRVLVTELEAARGGSR